jgi:hypothetical protein
VIHSGVYSKRLYKSYVVITYHTDPKDKFG